MFDTESGATRPASDADQSVVQSMRKGPQHSEAQPLDISMGGRNVLHVPSQESVTVGGQATSPTARAFVFSLEPPTTRYTRLEAWVALADGSRHAWPLGASVSELAWQPAALPPVLFVHGCGGAVTTWSDTGWFVSGDRIADLTSGAANGALYRGSSSAIPSAPAYALDYHQTGGSLSEVAGLLPASIDRIRDETGAAGVVLVTHSMGGVLAQYYTAGLSTAGAFRSDVVAAFLVAPPSRGAFLADIGGVLSNIFTCPQASELARNAGGIKKLRSATPAKLPYAVVAGTRFWLPFVGFNDGVIGADDVRPWNVAYDLRTVDGTHIDPLVLPNTISALCATVLNHPCVLELRMDEVVGLFRERYAKDAFK